MTQEALKLELEELANRFSEGWHKGIKIDASDIMLLSEAAEALSQRTEQNFCPRCGKRCKSAEDIHTCTPPQTQDGQCKRCTDGCPACDATKLQKEAHDLL